MRRSTLLVLDGIGNLLLGLLLLLFPAPLVELLGMPLVESVFYPSLFGAVLFGIGVALVVERFRPGSGLGLTGALIINLAFGLVLVVWLAAGDLSIPGRGYVVLWALAAVLIGIGGLEVRALSHRRAT